MSEYERGFAAGYAAAHRTDVRDITVERGSPAPAKVAAAKPRRKASAYSKKYGQAFRKVQGKYKLKSGKWAKDGFKRAQKAAHKLAKRMK